MRHEIKYVVARNSKPFKYQHPKYKITLGDVMKIERDERRLDFHDIGREIKQKRERKGMTQEQLAYIIDRDPRTVMYHENDGQHGDRGCNGTVFEFFGFEKAFFHRITSAPASLFIHSDGEEQEHSRDGDVVQRGGVIKYSEREVRVSRIDREEREHGAQGVEVDREVHKPQTEQNRKHADRAEHGGELVVCQRGDEYADRDEAHSDECDGDHAADDTSHIGIAVEAERDHIDPRDGERSDEHRERREVFRHNDGEKADGRGEQELLRFRAPLLGERAHCEHRNYDDVGEHEVLVVH